MVFCYFDCEKEQRGSDPIVLEKLYAEYKEALTIRDANIRKMWDTRMERYYIGNLTRHIVNVFGVGYNDGNGFGDGYGEEKACKISGVQTGG